MPLPIEDIEAQALGLPPEERARLVERLIASFEPKSAAQAAWMVLAQRRREDVRSGKTAMVPGEQALARVRARLA
jgi:putative addiction module component (TIGR02574 family)